jgi:hypothetical protein
MPGILVTLLPLITSLFDRLIPDPTARAREQAAFISQLTDAASKADLSQMEINKAEAQSSSMFVAGWRPFIGWIGGAIFAWHYLIKYMILTFGSYFDAKLVTAVLNSAPLDENFWTVVTGLLGLGAMRTFEKVKGVAK